MSQPAVSRALARLRFVFADPLFVKGARGVIATPRAKALQGPMASLLAELASSIAGSAFDPTTSTRIFRIATTDYGALAVFAPAIGPLLEQAPGVGLDLVPLNEATFSELGSADIDLALYSDDATPLPLLSRAVFEERYVSLLRNGHPASAKLVDGCLPMETFLAHGHILVNLGGDRAGVVDAAAACVGLRAYDRRDAAVLLDGCPDCGTNRPAADAPRARRRVLRASAWIASRATARQAAALRLSPSLACSQRQRSGEPLASRSGLRARAV